MDNIALSLKELINSSSKLCLLMVVYLFPNVKLIQLC